jgi:nitrate reductase NapE component
MNEPYGNIKPGDSRDIAPQMGVALRTFIVVHVLVFLPLLAVGWIGHMTFAFLRAGWDAAEEFLDGNG